MSTTWIADRHIVLETLSCGACDFTFAVPQSWLDDRRERGDGFHCPRGCSISYTDPENERLKRQLANARAQNTHLRDQREAAERSAAAYKGQVTKIRKRVGNGVCPCCNRSFNDLARHMANQHPDFKDGGDRG